MQVVLVRLLCRDSGSKYFADGAEAERILGVTNAQLAHCRSGNAVLFDFLGFISECERYPLKS